MSAHSLDDILKTFAGVMNTAICDTVRAFFANPWQFHGDTGVMHFLYHRVLTHGENVVVLRRDQRTTLLFQSEHCTALSYVQSGAREKSGRFDFALVDPSRIPANGDVRKAPAIAAIEVGRNKDLSKMGDFAASETASNVRPGDAAKLIREMRFCGLPLAYLVELYDDPKRAVLAPHVFAKVVEAADDAGLDGLHVLAGVRAADSTARVAVYPPDWRNDLRIDYPGLESPTASNPPRTRDFDDFIQRCGPTNQLLQKRIRQDFPRAGRWGRITMTVNSGKSREARITNLSYGQERGRTSEELLDLSDRLVGALREDGIPFREDGTVAIPGGERCDEEFVKRVLKALAKALAIPG